MALIFGLVLGRYVASLTETQMIDAAAADYVATERARGNDVAPIDCVARPENGIANWLIVTCTPGHLAPEQAYEYHVNPFGQILRVTPY